MTYFLLKKKKILELFSLFILVETEAPPLSFAVLFKSQSKALFYS